MTGLRFDPDTHTYTLSGVELPSVTHICRFLAYDYRSDRPWLAKAAADRGTRVHEACALIDYGEEPEETPDIAGYLTAYRRFLADYRPDWQLIEYPMGDADLGMAGTLDRFGLLDRHLAILDIKTGMLHDAALRAQLTGYQRLLANERREQMEDVRRYALRLFKDGTYDLRAVQEDDNLLAACLYLHKATERKKRK